MEEVEEIDLYTDCLILNYHFMVIAFTNMYTAALTVEVYFGEEAILLSAMKVDKVQSRASKTQRRARMAAFKDTSCLCFLSLVQIFALRTLSGNKSTDTTVCWGESAMFVCECMK